MSLTKWSLDPTHSEISFKIKHLMISTVTGQFKKFTLDGETETNDFNTAKKIEFTADIDSIQRLALLYRIYDGFPACDQ